MKHNIEFNKTSAKRSAKGGWLTDLHLDAADRQAVDRCFDDVAAEKPEALLIGGDIANGTKGLDYLAELHQRFSLPIYFVLGNHDYYYSSIVSVREKIKEKFAQNRFIHYLTESKVIPITESTGLIGHDGWSDAKAGNFSTSTVRLNDYLYINDFIGLSWEQLRLKLNCLGQEAADVLKPKLLEALNAFEQVLIITHVPPFEDVCLYEGQPTDGNWAPHFVCRSMGDMLLEVLSRFPDKEAIVLCGHSHHRAEHLMLPNLRVYAGHSDLGKPGIQGVLTNL